MLKFRCQHCGQRIAVPLRHLGKLVTCGECGATTHPVARGLVGPKQAEGALQQVADAPAAPAASACDNCGAAMGRLQASHAWNGHRVCGPCFGALQSDSARAMTPAAPEAAAVRRVDAAASNEAVRRIDLKERTVRALVVFVVAVVALYGALSLLRDIAGLIAVVSVAILALLALYAVFRGAAAARQKAAAASGPHPKVISARTAA